MLNHKTQVISSAKRKYLNKINQTLQTSSFTDKPSWRLIKKQKNKSSINIIPPLLHNNKTITDPTEKAEILHSVISNPISPNLKKA